MISALRQAFTGLSYQSSISHTKAHTPGRTQTLRDSGWDGVKGTHRERKYRKLDQLQHSLKDTESQVADFRKKRDEQNPTTEEWARLHRRMNEFADHATLLKERIQRQKNVIAESEA
jgi:DNA-binding transcriptional regulator GbsR (MarR family)